jgi:hypothetical protein
MGLHPFNLCPAEGNGEEAEEGLSCIAILIA